jgi:uncharacterized protein YjbI with pentapeptide repeats
MANQEQLDILNQGVESWNQWRKEHQDIIPDLSKADLIEANLYGANLANANLYEAKLEGADLRRADLRRANLEGADLSEANLTYADLSFANLSWSNICEANCSEANLTGCNIYAISAWNVTLEETIQTGLIITRDEEATITVDNLEVAQFIYLLLNNPRIRDVIDTVAKKAVLILGRFTPERKAVLDTLRQALRTHGYLPILFDFDKPSNRDFTETIMTLAGLCLFIIADITNPSSAPLELQATVPNYMIPFVPLLEEGEQPFAMFQDLKGKYDWVLDLLVYDTPSNLIKGLERAVIKPALEKRDELLATKVQQLRTRHIGEYL